MVYDPTSPNASLSPVEKTKNLEDVEKELLKMARDAADVKTEVIEVEKKWHDAVVGRGGTTTRPRLVDTDCRLEMAVDSRPFPSGASHVHGVPLALLGWRGSGGGG